MSCKIWVDDIGTEVLMDAKEDISSATVIKLFVQKPDNSVVEWVINPAHWPGVDEDHPVNEIKYLIQAGDLNLKGKYTVQSYVELPAWSGSGDKDSFQVWEKLTPTT